MIKALFFDVFGTVVDWRGSIAAEGRRRSLEIDWERFADRWRAGYAPAMNRVRTGALPWLNLDSLHRMILDEILPEFGLEGLSEQDKAHWNGVWGRLQPWADSIPGLLRLKRNFIIAPLSNGNVSLLTHMAKRAGFPWDVILSAELARHYKPDPEVYLTAAGLLGLEPKKIAMVAAHRQDLDAARGCGMQTAFVYRPYEFGPTGAADRAAPGDYDFTASDLLDLAAQLTPC